MKVVLELPNVRRISRMRGIVIGGKIYLNEEWRLMQVNRCQLALEVRGSLLEGGTPPGTSGGPVTCSFELDADPASQSGKQRPKNPPKKPAQKK